MKDFDKEFDAKFSYANFCWNGDTVVGEKFAKKQKREVKQFFHSQLQLLINEFKECLPTETYFTIGKNAKIYCDGFNSCREQMLKNLEKLK